MSAVSNTTRTATTVLEALKAGMSHAMQADPDVVLLGEDVARAGGIFRTSTGIFERYGLQTGNRHAAG